MWASELNKALELLIPFKLRGERMKAWVSVFSSLIAAIHEQLKQYRLATLRDAWMTPQVIMLEKYLNDRYEVESIYITDGEIRGPWLFTRAHEDQFILDQPDSFVWSASDNYHFIVWVPVALSDETSAIAAMVARFKLPGKRFMIITFA